MTIKKLLFLIVFLNLGFLARATHLVGGEITYECLGNNTYEITLRIYRDCYSGIAPFDPNAIISTYNQNNVLVANDTVPLGKITSLPLTAPNNCTSLPTNVCTEVGVYKYTRNLPPIVGGYTITHQRCCRNNTITNINNTNSQWGSTYTNSIPSMDVACNSSPVFKDDPPVILCLGINVSLDLGVTDANGDSLHYELCEVLNGGFNSGGGIAPNPAAAPPYIPVPFLAGYTITQPISSFPLFAINPQTGVLRGTPSAVGQFVFAICVTEYRNGIPLSTTRRDFQFNVSGACQAIVSGIESQFVNPQNKCSGGHIQFQNKSRFATNYYWDFGDPTTTSDTSRLANPSYFYVDTGSYNVMLVADPRTPCADTSYRIFKVFDSTTVHFTFSGDPCFNSNSFSFFTTGDYGPNASFQWDFDGTTNLGAGSTLEEPKNVSWLQPGKHFVRITVSEFDCYNTFADTITIYSDPVFSDLVNQQAGCLPYTANFSDNSQAMTPLSHQWEFGDGTTSTKANPSHTYYDAGNYTVTHKVLTTEGCVDSEVFIYQNAVTVYPVPKSALEWESKITDIFDPEFFVANNSRGHVWTETLLPDGSTVQNLTSTSFSLSDTGNFLVYHISYNEFNCTDTLIDTIRVDDPFTLFIPSAFSPNGDGVNDIFNFKMSGISNMEIEIYSRWGEVVYSSTNPYAGWDGTVFNSNEEAPGGIYSYVFKGEVKDGGRIETVTGTIMLLR